MVELGETKQSDKGFWPLFWAHMNHPETRWMNTFAMVSFVLVACLILLFWPNENKVNLVLSNLLFFAYLALSAPINYASIGLDPSVEKRHIVFSVEASWARHLTSMLVGIPICIYWCATVVGNWQTGVVAASIGLLFGQGTIAIYKARAKRAAKMG